MPKVLLSALFLVLVTASTVSSSIPPSLEITPTQSEIEIDGELTENAWSSAARAKDFAQAQPTDDVEPSVGTEVYVTYDESHLYLAFVCQDDPNKIRSTLTDRDDMYGDDFVGIILDTYGDAIWAYEFYVNPLGVQGDLRWVANQGEDSRFDLVYESAGKVSENGWQAEMAIPFSSLRFPDKEEQVWRATFWRSHPRDNLYKYSWAPIKLGEPCFFCQMGYLKGIKGVKSGGKLDLLPSVISYQAGQLSDPDDLKSPFDNSNPDAEAALNIRYQFSPGLMAEGALNPDFSQVESDAAQIDVNTTFALFFPERRPFFQEGSDLYNTQVSAIYTRSINDPDGALKFTGRKGRTSFFYLSAHDENSPYILPLEEQSEFVAFGKSTSNIARVRHTFLDDSFIGALVTDRRIDGGGDNSVYGGDISLRLFNNYRVEAQVLGSRTSEGNDPAISEDLADTTFDDGRYTVALDGETYNGHAAHVSVERDARLWNFDISLEAYSPTFRADNGFIIRNDYRLVDAWTGLFFRPNGQYVTRVTPSVAIGRLWNYRGERKDEWLRLMMDLSLTGQTYMGYNFLVSQKKFRGVWFDDIRMLTFWLENSALHAFRWGVNVSYGNTIARTEDPLPVMGRSTSVNFNAAITPLEQLTIRPSYTYLKLLNRDTREKLHEGFVTRTHINYQFTRELFVRLVVQYNDFSEALSVEPLLTYKINPFTVFYIGSSMGYDWEFGDARNPYDTHRQFFLKLQYLFRS